MPLKQHRHYGHHLVVAYLVVALVLTPLPLPRTLGIILAATLVVVIVVGTIGQLRHTWGALCQPCIASMPLNAQDKADKAKPLLRVTHLITDGRANAITYYGILLGLTGASVALSINSDPYSVPYVISHELSLALLLVVTIAFRTHSKYTPWCPYCNGGGRGDSQPANGPDPTIPQPA